jgi:hypothetical protein
MEKLMTSATKLDSTAAFFAGLYWIGVLMTLTCLACILAGNTQMAYRFEHTGFPLSWALAGLAVLAFLAAEFFRPAAVLSSEESQDESSEFAPEWEVVGFKADPTRAS